MLRLLHRVGATAVALGLVVGFLPRAAEPSAVEPRPSDSPRQRRAIPCNMQPCKWHPVSCPAKAAEMGRGAQVGADVSALIPACHSTSFLSSAQQVVVSHSASLIATANNA